MKRILKAALVIVLAALVFCFVSRYIGDGKQSPDVQSHTHQGSYTYYFCLPEVVDEEQQTDDEISFYK